MGEPQEYWNGFLGEGDEWVTLGMIGVGVAKCSPWVEAPVCGWSYIMCSISPGSRLVTHDAYLCFCRRGKLLVHLLCISFIAVKVL